MSHKLYWESPNNNEFNELAQNLENEVLIKLCKEYKSYFENGDCTMLINPNFLISTTLSKHNIKCGISPIEEARCAFNLLSALGKEVVRRFAFDKINL